MMKIKTMMIVLAALAVGLLTAGWARAGSLDSPASPTNSASAMWTLNDIYNKLDVRSNVVVKRTGGFAEPAAGPTNGTMCTLNDIMMLVTNRAPPPRTGQTVSRATNDDGALQLGVAWPTNRFTVGTNTTDQPNDTNCVLDNLTGLMWARNVSNACGLASASAKTNWGAAVTSCNDLVYGGYDDWRLPNMFEISSVLTFGGAYYPCLPTNHPFNNIPPGANQSYWTSSSLNASTAFYTEVGRALGYQSAKTTSYYVWPVRRGGAP